MLAKGRRLLTTLEGYSKELQFHMSIVEDKKPFIPYSRDSKGDVSSMYCPEITIPIIT